MGIHQVPIPGSVAPAPVSYLDRLHLTLFTLDGWVVMMAPADEKDLKIVYQPMLDLSGSGSRFITVT
jgi:hypothetical protein